jgi:cobalt/nickel transport system permease protein
VLVWWAIAVGITALCIYGARRQGRPKGRMITLAAFCTAAAFAVFQVNIPVLGGIHLNLTPLIGILTGPAIGSLVVLIANILSAAIGHGGFGMIGANTLVNVVEVTTAYLAYRALKNLINGGFGKAGIATFVALFAGNLMMIVIIVISGIQGVTQSPSQVFYGLLLIAIINMGAAIIEAVVTGFMISFIEEVRPELLGGIR